MFHVSWPRVGVTSAKTRGPCIGFLILLVHAHLAGLPFALQLYHYVFVTHTCMVSFFCRYAQVTKRVTSGHKQVYDVIVLPQQQPAVVKFARHPYSEEVHVECANRQLAPELLGVYLMPGGFNQVQSLAQNSSACSINEDCSGRAKSALCNFSGNC